MEMKQRMLIVGILILLVMGIVAVPAVALTQGNAARNISGSSQVILSMGEKQGTIIISWKGEKTGPRLLRISDDKNSLPVTVPVRASRTELMGGKYYRFKAVIDNLENGTQYWYEIGDGTVFDSPKSFIVPKNGGDDVFAYLGDPQFDLTVNDYKAWGEITEQMYETTPEVEFVLMGGDMVNLPGREDHWNGFFDNCGLFSTVPLMTVPGNHEGVTSNNTYKKLFNHIGNGPDGEAFYYFDHGHCRFIMLDSSFFTGARQITMGTKSWNAKASEIDRWLARTLRTSKKTWNIVVVHHPIYGMHDLFTVSSEMRERWLPIMKEEHVDLVLSGHQHVYMRTIKMDGITYIMGVSGSKRSKYYKGFNKPVYCESVYSAGANYQIFRATTDVIEITSYSKTGNIIDAARIKKDIKFPYFRTSW